jgi:predicted nuclease with TOPRIM domain
MKEKLARLRRLIEQLTLVLREERQENLRLRSRLASAQAELDQAQQRLKKLNAQIQQLNRLTNPAEFES